MAAAQRFMMGLALVLCLCSSWFPSSEAILEFGLGSAAIKTSFFRLGFSVCHQSEVCGVNGKTYRSPCEMEDDGIDMDCKRPCPCEKPNPGGRKGGYHHPDHLPHVEDIWISAPAAIIISTPEQQQPNSHSGDSGSVQEQGHGSSEVNEHGHQQQGGQNEQENDVCRKHADPGPCQPNEYHVQYYFDFRRGSCSPFLYGGCEGNNNRFSSREDCQQACAQLGK